MLCRVCKRKLTMCLLSSSLNTEGENSASKYFPQNIAIDVAHRSNPSSVQPKINGQHEISTLVSIVSPNFLNNSVTALRCCWPTSTYISGRTSDKIFSPPDRTSYSAPSASIFTKLGASKTSSRESNVIVGTNCEYLTPPELCRLIVDANEFAERPAQQSEIH